MKNRTAWVDIAKAFGLFWVFYCHVAQTFFFSTESQTTLLAFKVPVSYLISFFFILGGYMYKPRNYVVGSRIKHLFLTRMVPVYFFTLASITIAALIGQVKIGQGLFVFLLFVVPFGIPLQNFPMWYLVCLFTTETLHLLLSRWVDHSRTLIFSMLGAFAIGSLISWQWSNFTSAIGIQWPSIWFIQEAFMTLGFYQLGIMLRHYNAFDRAWSKPQWAGIALFGLITTVITANLNNGPFIGQYLDDYSTSPEVVYMALTDHGNLFWFFVTSFTGTLFMVGVAKLIPPLNWLLYLGRNTILLLGINGFWLFLFNHRLIAWVNSTFFDGAMPDNMLLQVGTITFLSIITMALSAPLMPLLNRFVPKFVGQWPFRAELIS